MIKINLAGKKRSSYANASSTTTVAKVPGIFDKLQNLQLSGSSLAGVPVKSLLITGALSVGLYFWFDIQKQEEVAKVAAQVAKETADQAKLRAEFEKTKGYELKKKSLEADEKILRTKIDTIKKLTSDRDSPPKLLREIAESIPKDLWISTLEVDEEKKAVLLRGKTYAATSLNSFMNAVRSSSLLESSDIRDSTTERDPAGTEIVSFTIEAKRK